MAKPAAPSNATTAPTAATSTAPAAAPTGLAGQAAARAAADTAAVVAGIRAQQDAANQQAALRAAQQAALGTAASKFLAGLDLGGRTAADYATAAAAQTQAAQGFQGSLQQTVSDAARGVQANLAAIGSPQTAIDQGQAAGNALYGLGGYLPSAQLGVVGPTMAAALRSQPGALLGQGQYLAMGELGQGAQQAAALNADITAAYAKQPTLARDYLDTLQAAAAKARQDTFDNAVATAKLKLQASSAAETAKYHTDTLNVRTQIANAQIDLANQKAAAPQFHNVGGNLYAYNPSTGKLTLAAQAPTKPTYYTDAFGRRVAVSPDGTQTVMSSGKFTDATGAVYQVGTNDALTPLSAGKTPTAQTQIVTIGKQQWLVDKATGAKIQYIGPAAAGSTPSPSVSAGTAVPRLDPSRSAINGVKSDQYGNWLNYGTKKKPRYSLVSGWSWGKNGQPVKNAEPTSVSRTGLKDARSAADLFYYGKHPSATAVASLLTSEKIDPTLWDKPLPTNSNVTYRQQAESQVGGIPGISYPEALQKLITEYGITPSTAMQMLANYYAPGERGRPLFDSAGSAKKGLKTATAAGTRVGAAAGGVLNFFGG